MSVSSFSKDVDTWLSDFFFIFVIFEGQFQFMFTKAELRNVNKCLNITRNMALFSRLFLLATFIQINIYLSRAYYIYCS